jgi:hypothetical protein
LRLEVEFELRGKDKQKADIEMPSVAEGLMG